MLQIHSFDFAITKYQSKLRKKMEEKTTIKDALDEWLKDPSH